MSDKEGDDLLDNASDELLGRVGEKGVRGMNKVVTNNEQSSGAMTQGQRGGGCLGKRRKKTTVSYEMNDRKHKEGNMGL